MKNKYEFIEGTKKWWIIAGILFLLFPSAYLFSFVLEEFLSLLYTLNIIDFTLFPASYTEFYYFILFHICYLLFTMLTGLLLGIGCFVHKKTTLVFGITLILSSLISTFQLLVSLISNATTLANAFHYSTTFTLIISISTLLINLSITALFALAKLFMGISAMLKFSKRVWGIIGFILSITYLLANCLTSIYTLIIIFADGVGSVIFWTSVFPSLISVASSFAFIIPCFIVIFFAGRTELPSSEYETD